LEFYKNCMRVVNICIKDYKFTELLQLTTQTTFYFLVANLTPFRDTILTSKDVSREQIEAFQLLVV